MKFSQEQKVIIRQEMWRAIHTPDFSMFATLEYAKEEFAQWHATQKWPNKKLLADAMQATSTDQLVTMATNSLGAGLRWRLANEGKNK